MRRAKAFTLVELLLVVALITILISLLLPTLAKVKNNAKLSLCQANLKAIGEGALSYAAHNASRYPQRPGTGKPTVIKGAGTDFRPMIREFISPSLLRTCVRSRR